MSEEGPVYVFDTGPLRHFAMQGWLGVLKFITGGRGVIPASVALEINQQAIAEPALLQVSNASWITVDDSTDLTYLEAFARYESLLVSGDFNRGECGVLALGATRGFTLVLDDAVPRRVGKNEGLDVTGTLGLLCKGIREEQLTISMVESLADDLLSGQYFLPFGPGGFRKWATGEGALEQSRPIDK